jgi:hypothetical protein
MILRKRDFFKRIVREPPLHGLPPGGNVAHFGPDSCI